MKHELFARFGVADSIMNDKRSRLTLAEFKSLCDTSQINHITAPQYHDSWNGQSERFDGTLKRALKKAEASATDSAAPNISCTCIEL